MPAFGSLPFQLNEPQRQAFEFFCKHSASQLAGSFSSGLWERLVLQAGQQEAVVLHAMVAVGCMHRAQGMYYASASAVLLKESEEYQLGLQQHSKALIELQQYINASAASPQAHSSVEIVLLVCLLCICFEMLQREQGPSLAHMRNGLGILFEHLKSTSGRRPNDSSREVGLTAEHPDALKLLLRCFVYLDTQSSLIGVAQPYLTPSLDPNMQNRLDTVTAFKSVEEAKLYFDVFCGEVMRERGHLQGLARNALKDILQEQPDWAKRYAYIHAASRSILLEKDPDFDKRVHNAIRNLDSWSSALAAMPGDENEVARTTLRLQFFPVYGCALLLRSTRELRSDFFEPLCEQVLELVQRQLNIMSLATVPRTFALEPVILPALYAVALKCRTSRLRRRAIEMLRSINFQEGLWNGKVTVPFLEMVADLEENRARHLNPELALKPDLTYADIPEQARYVDIVNAMEGHTTGRLVCARFAHETGGELVIEEHFLDLSEFGTTENGHMKEDDLWEESTESELYGKRCFPSGTGGDRQGPLGELDRLAPPGEPSGIRKGHASSNPAQEHSLMFSGRDPDLQHSYVFWPDADE
jgi:hypothetical protein